MQLLDFGFACFRPHPAVAAKSTGLSRSQSKVHFPITLAALVVSPFQRQLKPFLSILLSV